MTDKVQKIREEVERLFNHVKDSDFESDSGAFYYLKDLLDFIDSLQEEPASEDLEEFALQYAGHHAPYDSCMQEVEDAVKAGAEWQKTQEYTCYEEAFEDGAKWKKEKTIDKACKWIDENAAKYLVDRFVDSTRVVGIDTSITEDFRKDMGDE